MSKSQDKITKLKADLDAFFSLPQEDRINLLQAVILDKVTDEETSPSDVSKLSNAFIESTNLRKENRLEFDNTTEDIENLRQAATPDDSK